MSDKKRLALYLRCSTRKQTVESQRIRLRKFAEIQEWEIVEEYVDAGFSGITDQRPALQLLLKDLREKKQIDAVAVMQISRFGRSLKSILEHIEMLDKMKVGFISLTENIDTTSDDAFSRLTLHLIGALGQCEHQLLKERILAGQQSWRSNNPDAHFGRPPCAISLTKLLEYRSQGVSIRKIAKKLGCSPATITRRLKEVQNIKENPELGVSKSLQSEGGS
jgi:DNA invertase Pin-like site-specific DNA recombinase